MPGEPYAGVRDGTVALALRMSERNRIGLPAILTAINASGVLKAYQSQATNRSA
jgi:hypothetical protein